MTESRQISDIMSPGVVSVTAGSSLEAAIHLMLEQRISGLPVVDETGTVVGMLTEGDLLRRAELGTEAPRAAWLQFLRGPARQADDYVATHSRVVGDIMTSPVFTVEATDPLATAVAVMCDKHVKRVPVLRRGRLVGVISRSDLLRALARALGSMPAHADGPFRDEDIQAAVSAALNRQPWAQAGEVTVRVLDGVVDLDGVVLENADRAAMRVMAQNVAGVVSVRDHLVWVEPYSGVVYPPP